MKNIEDYDLYKHIKAFLDGVSNWFGSVWDEIIEDRCVSWQTIDYEKYVPHLTIKIEDDYWSFINSYYDIIVVACYIIYYSLTGIYLMQDNPIKEDFRTYQLMRFVSEVVPRNIKKGKIPLLTFSEEIPYKLIKESNYPSFENLRPTRMFLQFFDLADNTVTNMNTIYNNPIRNIKNSLYYPYTFFPIYTAKSKSNIAVPIYNFPNELLSDKGTSYTNLQIGVPYEGKDDKHFINSSMAYALYLYIQAVGECHFIRLIYSFKELNSEIFTDAMCKHIVHSYNQLFITYNLDPATWDKQIYSYYDNDNGEVKIKLSNENAYKAMQDVVLGIMLAITGVNVFGYALNKGNENDTNRIKQNILAYVKHISKYLKVVPLLEYYVNNTETDNILSYCQDKDRFNFYLYEVENESCYFVNIANGINKESGELNILYNVSEYTPIVVDVMQTDYVSPDIKPIAITYIGVFPNL